VAAGPEETKNLAGKSSPPDSDPFGDAESDENYANSSSTIAASANRRFKLNERSQLFIRCQPGNGESQSETRIAIGFCLIRQSSVSPIVAVHQLNQVSGRHSIGMPRRFMVVPWSNERRVGAPAALPSGDPELKVKWLA
jgi:hypothetical protein